MELIKQLLERNVVFALCVSNQKLKLGSNKSSLDYIDKDYYIIISDTDKNRISVTPGEVDSSGYSNGICEITATREELRYLKVMGDSFKIAQNNEEGRVYEISEMPFKKYFSAMELHKKISAK